MAKRIAKNRKLSRKQESDKDDIINQYIIFCKVFNEQTKHRKVVWNSIKNTCGLSDADKVTKTRRLHTARVGFFFLKIRK